MISQTPHRCGLNFFPNSTQNPLLHRSGGRLRRRYRLPLACGLCRRSAAGWLGRTCGRWRGNMSRGFDWSIAIGAKPADNEGTARRNKESIIVMSAQIRLVFSIMAMSILSACTTSPRTPDIPDTPTAPDTQTKYYNDIWWNRYTDESRDGHYYVWRADTADGERTRVAKFHSRGNTFCYYDLNVEPDHVYYYSLERVEADGSSRWAIGDPSSRWFPKPMAKTPRVVTEQVAQLIDKRGTEFITHRWIQ